ncbi:hypothetical protein VNO77_20197 [Canavalia gladiata]|uniref:Uncharacterized protein n=1 Tax=Canavalia gladiata TaxID=3824 RepID=A0AAN9LNV1_CANGL
MKGILIAIFLLLASVIFPPTSTIARELKATERLQTGDPTKPAINCDPNKPYSSCVPPKPPAAPRCPTYTRKC